MDTVLLVIHLIVAVTLICIILMQRSSQDGGGLMGGGGGGTMGGLFTARGSANLLSRATAILATVFITLSLILGIMASQRHDERSMSLIDQALPAAEESSNDIKESVQGIADKVGDAAQEAADKTKDAVKKAVEDIKEKAPEVPSVPVAK